MKDVAGVAGVSLATVSRVVNGRNDVRVDLAARVRDAIEVLGYRRDLTASTLRRADRMSASIGLVFVDRPPSFIDADAVLTDNAGGARTGVEHLLSAGHRRIAFLGDRAAIHTAVERLAGYRSALSAAGVPADPALERVGLVDSTLAAAAALELLSAPDPPTAIFAGQNLITVGVLRALRELGLQRDVGLVGFDDVMLGDMTDPGITVVWQDPYELGRRAAELLFAQLGGAGGRTRRIELPTRLVARGSGEIAPAGASASSG